MKGVAINYSSAELKWVSDNRTLESNDLHRLFCKRFNRFDVSVSNLKSLKLRNGWKTGRTGQFKKGHVPHPDAGTKCANNTSFKKGNRPHNWRPLGSRRVSKDGYIEIKTDEPRKWAQLHVLIWTAEHGDIPPGYCLNFIDGDKTNIELNNLELVTRNENLQINRLGGSDVPAAVRPVVRTLGKLNARLTEVNS